MAPETLLRIHTVIMPASPSAVAITIYPEGPAERSIAFQDETSAPKAKNRNPCTKCHKPSTLTGLDHNAPAKGLCTCLDAHR
eukprot:XP_001704786.1 Hypothetical protein GL50803_93584 [Giardia lamblia ATCC 50803]